MDISLEEFDFSKYYGQYGYYPEKNFVVFYGNKGQDLLGNFWPMPKNISYNGVKANNIEALYHSAKFPLKISKKFNGLTAIKSFFLSRKYKKYVRQDWELVKEDVMLDLLRIKFHNPLCALVLLATGSRYLVEHNPIKGRDNYWSDDHNGTGLNRLGILLMKIRKELHGYGIVEKPTEYIGWINNK